MSAASYVGRVGGLAIALGVGTAILTGQGVAYADDTDTSTPSSVDAGSLGPSTRDDTVTIDKQPAGRHRSNERTSSTRSVNGIIDRVAGERQEPADVAGDDLDDVELRARHGGSSESTDRAERRDVESPQNALPSSAEAGATVEELPANERTQGLSWLRSPKALAGREVQQAEVPPESATPLWTPPSSLITEGREVAAPAVSPVTTILSDLVTSSDDAQRPSVPDDGSAPVGGSIPDLMLLAGARREAAQIHTLGVSTYSVDVVDGVVVGCTVSGPACSTPDGSIYTVIDGPSKGGKLTLDARTGAFRFLPFADEKTDNGPTGRETFSVLVARNTQFTTFVTSLPIIGATLIAPIIQMLQQAHIFAGLIGTADRQDITVDLTALRGIEQTPVAYTTFVTSWDKTQISVNFFPAIATGAPDDGVPGAETIFNGPGLAQAGATDPNDPFVKLFRNYGYNVVTWDPRGEFASGGVLQLDSPQYEGQDVQKIIDWVATQKGVELDDATKKDPRMGMVGVSYGGGIQLVTAINDDRVDAIAPGWAWNTLPDSLYPDKAFRTSYSALLLLGLIETGARINPQIYSGILTGASLGVLTPSQIQLLQNSGPGLAVKGITIPTLLIQGTVDVLFPLQQAVINASLLTQSPDVKMLWFCGGHGTCLPGQGNAAADNVWVFGEMGAWMNRYIKGNGPADPISFEWTDQKGVRWASDRLPTDAGFYDPVSSVPKTTWTTGKTLPIIPFIGGSGPSPNVNLPYSLGDGSTATNAVTIPLTNPAGDANVVGAPHVEIAYSGLGTSRHIYAQVVDNTTRLVVGNIVTPIPVTLNGRDQTAKFDLNDIAYTMTPGSDLSLQIFTTATPFLNLTQFGFVNIKSVEVTLPTTTKGTIVAGFDPLLAEEQTSAA